MNFKFLDIKPLILASILTICANCQNSSGKIFGIGVGTFIIIIAIAFSVVWCLACRSSSNPEVYSIIGVIIPIILFIIFIFMPKQSERPLTTSITDSNFIPHIVFLVISIVGLIVALVFILLNQVFVFRKAKNIARAAFIVKDQEEQRLGTNINVPQGQRQEEIRSSNNEISLGDSPRKNNQTQLQNRPLRRS